MPAAPYYREQRRGDAGGDGRHALRRAEPVVFAAGARPPVLRGYRQRLMSVWATMQEVIDALRETC
ncbi:hypothetical protein ACOKM3_02055 [Streptomyces sp. BH106]|uniref:hypothetical protein n=1 Tax=Streptomyces sp. BH106 TaxID=3410409 RepID=UPI003CF0E49F